MIVYDFSKLASLESVEELKAKLEQKLPADVSILVNNVGCNKVALLDRLTTTEMMRMINVNINA